jgi:DNA-binding MarR family transcriptional regulator
MNVAAPGSCHGHAIFILAGRAAPPAGFIESRASPLYHRVMKRREHGGTAGFMQTVAALADFRRELRQFLNFNETMVGAVGVTSQQYQALLVILLGGEHGVMIKDLAAEMLLVPHGAVQLVNRLEDASLVERRGDEADARVSRIHPTLKAIELMRLLVPAHARELQQHEQLLARSLRALRRLADDETAQ